MTEEADATSFGREGKPPVIKISPPFTRYAVCKDERQFGNPEKGVGLFARDLDARENIVVLLSALGIKGDPERFFDRLLPAERWVSCRYLVFSSGIYSCFIRDAVAGSN